MEKIIELKAKDFLEKDEDQTVVFEMEGLKYKGVITSISTNGTYKIKVEGRYEYGY